jgi:chromodomain-helicase-DNA-binding protein 1
MTEAIACRQKGIPHPHLIVVPLSTLPNWERELSKWAPQMYVVCLKGNQGSRKTIRKYDCFVDAPVGEGGRGRRRDKPIRFNVMLTTYEVMQQVCSLVVVNYLSSLLCQPLSCISA